jgi:hypothetical protein
VKGRFNKPRAKDNPVTKNSMRVGEGHFKVLARKQMTAQPDDWVNEGS